MPCYIWTIHYEYRMVDASIKRCAKRWRKGKRKYPRHIGGDRQGNHYDFTPADSKQSPVLMLTGFRDAGAGDETVPATQQRATMAAQVHMARHQNLTNTS